jgi:sterol desaturase/sphingolipid hydroxylase (fatty acid hydroxylase superfamily)
MDTGYYLREILCWQVWPLIISVPLFLTYNNNYTRIFPANSYDSAPLDAWNLQGWPSPLGLSLGLLAVVVGQLVTILYFITFRSGYLSQLFPVQKEGAPPYKLMDGIKAHAASPEGLLLLGGYLVLSWMFGLMPASYYSFSGGINWMHVAGQLLLQDFIQFINHKLEHDLDPRIYRASHKPHHRFTNPKLWDAFNGSVADTVCMILIPLAITARCIPANVWSYMTFGALYSCWLTLIHSEYVHPWDHLFRIVGFGTAADHHVHHKLFVYNYGHIFM